MLAKRILWGVKGPWGACLLSAPWGAQCARLCVLIIHVQKEWCVWEYVPSESGSVGRPCLGHKPFLPEQVAPHSAHLSPDHCFSGS